MKEIIGEFNEYFRNLIGENIDRYGIIFETKNNKYFFDTGTGKALQCNDNVYILLHHLFKNNGEITKDITVTDEGLEAAIKELKEAIDEENIFKARELKKFECRHTCNLGDEAGKKCNQLILEVTEKCNLRCKYCIYGDDTANFRNFGMKDMDFETAKKAMDFILPIADKEHMYLSFYGGEPLIQFDLVKKSVEYFNEHYQGEQIDYSITSNLTLLTEEMAEFMADHKFSVTCSLDGNKEIHNANRPYCDGRGSFDDTIRGLKLLIETYGDNTELISINMVINRPYLIEKFEAIQKFYEEAAWLPKSIEIRTSYAGRDEWEDNIENESNMELINAETGYNDSLETWLFDRTKGDAGNSTFTESSLESGLSDIHKRPISDTPLNFSWLNACCIPGSRRLYVTVDGNFSVCERIGLSPDIGNVDTGFDFEKLKKSYVDDYIEKSIKNCNNCWAVQLCNVCYARCFDEEGLDMKRKKILCGSCRFHAYRSLQRYYTLLEEKPQLLEHLNDIEYV